MLYMFISAFGCLILAGLGAGIVFFIKSKSDKSESFMHGFASGIMLASSIFCLIVPALEYCENLSVPSFPIFFLCFLLTGIIFAILEFKGKKDNSCEVNIPLLITGVAVHNIPEGICLGVAFASAVNTGTTSAIMSAILIAVGVGVQNIPEGSSVSFPLCSKGMSKGKSVLYAILVATVEAVSCIISFFIGALNPIILPIMLTFAGATMIIVSVSDLLPIAISKNSKIAFFSMLIGFLIMMSISLLLG